MKLILEYRQTQDFLGGSKPRQNSTNLRLIPSYKIPLIRLLISQLWRQE